MSPERWKQVERIYGEALERHPSERAGFLNDACAGDGHLRDEVQSLLAEAERCSGFLSSPALESALQSIARMGPEPAEPLPGPRRPWFFWFALAVAAAMLGVFGCSAWVINRGPGGRDFGWDSSYSSGGWMVLRGYPGGPAEGKLKSGDRILAFNGDPRAARIGPDAYRQFLFPGSRYSLRVLRGGVAREYGLRVEPWRDWTGIPRDFSYLALGFVNFATGLALALLKPRYRLAQLGFATQMLAALRNLASPLSMHPGTPPDLEFALNQIAGLSFPCVLAVAYDFFLKMSAGAATETLWGAIKRVLYGASAVLAASQVLYLAGTLLGQATLVNLLSRYFWLAGLDLIFLKTSWNLSIALAFSAICALIVWGYHRSRDINYRRRVRWFAAGCVVGIAPGLLLNLVGSLIGSAGQRAWLVGAVWGNLRWMTDASMIAVPAALTYGVLQHQMLDISVAIHRGLRYMLARRILQSILILPIAGLLLPVIRHPDRTVAEILRQGSSVVNLALLVLTGLSLKYRRQMRDWLDRRFFRETYQQQAILQRLLLRIKELDSVEEVSSLACSEIDSALHPKWLYFCRWKGGKPGVTLVHAATLGALPVREGASPAVLQLLSACKKSRECAVSASHAGNSRKVLVIPVTGAKWGEGGALLLGERKSEEPYTEKDRTLLDAVAGAMAVVFENLKLKSRVEEEARERREVLGRLDRENIQLLKECPECGACFDGSMDTCTADGSALALALPVERTIGHRYRLDRRIGKGGMGVVYAAMDLELGRGVAVKVMTGSLFGDVAGLRRFEREARILAQLSHPHIVALHDFGRLGGEGAYLVMEHLAGSSWRTELQRQGRIKPDVAAVWFDQLLDGLSAAHHAGIVHRDLKPENVIVNGEQDGVHRLKILDFGLAKELTQTVHGYPGLTETGMVMGTVAYMSPEQLRGDGPESRSDVFSVGVMAVEAITGSLPRRDVGGGVDISALPGPLQQVLSRCLASDSARRSSAIELRRELPRVLRSAKEIPAGSD